MSGGVVEFLLAGAFVASLPGLIVVAVRARSRSGRLNSLVRPLHELRGALTALQLGLSRLERPDPWSERGNVDGRPPILSARTDGLLLQLERARLALDDLDACLEGRAGADEPGGVEFVDMKALVLRGTRAWSQLAPCYGAQVRANWRAGGAQVEGRAGRLAQALDNLIANAVEHGGGRVLVESDLVGRSIRVAVVDRGRGVSPPAQLREASARSPRGHGLAITRDVIAAHGGELFFERRGRGAAVVIELPIADPDVALEPRCGTKSLPVQASTRAPRAA